MKFRDIDLSATGARLADIRARKGLTVRNLADEIGCTEVTLYRWMRGDSIPSTFELLKILEYFDLNLEDLIVFKDPEGGDSYEQH